jgi:GNAT superfamily N-acetyltransferase
MVAPDAFHVRAATSADASAICEVLRQSIIQLCIPDHNNHAEALSQWLANKTPENIEQWIANPANMMRVVEASGAVVAVGCVTAGGVIALNYVAPSARFRGASKELMTALEELALANGNPIAMLESTLTAHRFYRSLGYEDQGKPDIKHGLTTFPMHKRLSG